MDKVFTNIKIEKFMKENGIKTNVMVKDQCSLKMENSMKENGFMEREMVMVNIM